MIPYEHLQIQNGVAQVIVDADRTQFENVHLKPSDAKLGDVLLPSLPSIGEGIFLSPLIINQGWARSKEAAAMASLFLLVNSLAGLAGQFIKEPPFLNWKIIFCYLLLC